jgi:hypothetical protein
MKGLAEAFCRASFAVQMGLVGCRGVAPDRKAVDIFPPPVGRVDAECLLDTLDERPPPQKEPSSSSSTWRARMRSRAFLPPPPRDPSRLTELLVTGPQRFAACSSYPLSDEVVEQPHFLGDPQVSSID